MTQTQTLLKTSAEIAREFEAAGMIDPKELQAILNAISLIKKNGGWGEVTYTYKNCDFNDANILIHQKPAKDV